MRGLRPPMLPLPPSVVGEVSASGESAVTRRFSGREVKDAGGAGSGEQERDCSPSLTPGSKSGSRCDFERDGHSFVPTASLALESTEEAALVFDAFRVGLAGAAFDASAAFFLVVILAGSELVVLATVALREPIVAWKEGNPAL